MTKMQVCAATVAYNNPKELTRLLLSLSSQGPVLNGLIVIDNSDGSHVAENRKVFETHSKQYPFAHYHKTKSNEGSAGGFRRGMMVAHENGFDWVWLFDQDGAVSDRCLTELLKRADSGDILCPKTVDIDHPGVVHTFAVKKNFLGRSHPIPVTAKNRKIDAFGTHGVLISKQVMDSIGYYDACHFFVGYDDYDFGRRAQQANFAIIGVEAAEARHPGLRKSAPTQDAAALQGPQHNTTSPKRVHEVAVTAESTSSIVNKFRPAQFRFITNPSRSELYSERVISLQTFSQFYLFTESLKSWQFAAAFVYSCSQLLIAIAKDQKNEICVKKTLNAYMKCFASNLRKEWPYGCVEEFCRHILE